MYLWGAGTNGGWCLDYCKRNNISVLGYIDRNKTISASDVSLPVITPEQYRHEYPDKPILVTAKHSVGEIIKNNPDLQMIMPFDAFFLLKHIGDYEGLEFDDDESYNVLSHLKEYMLYSEPESLYDITEGNQYFAISPFFNTGYEGYVDLGAYVGDTIENFLFRQCGSFNHIWAFEPGERQYAALTARMDRLVKEWALNREKITLENAGVGRTDGSFFLSDTNHLPGMQLLESGEKEIKVVSLDGYFNSDDKVSFIKSDIEGMEYEMLLGAEDVIRTRHPKLALSVYHKPDDLIRIYNLIKSYDGYYRFSLRSHSSLMMDTTLYCY